MNNEQLDRLAATEVMKWAVFDLNTPGYSEAPCPKIIQNVIGEWIFFDVDGNTIKWSPTTNEQHAAMVREKMRADGWILILRVHPDFHYAKWINDRDRSKFAESKLGLPSVAYAITQAALLAVGAITEEELNWRKQPDGSYRLDDVWTVQADWVTGLWYAMRGNAACLVQFADAGAAMEEAERLRKADKLYAE